MRSLVLALLIPTATWADGIRIVTDIAPVQSLVAQVTEGVTDPGLLVSGTASPHSFTFRPSDARKVQEADVVIWVGEAMTPWLEDPLATLAPEATVIELFEAPGWTPLATRRDAAFDVHGHDEHDEDSHDEHDEDGHDHGLVDPHAWLDPHVAKVWLQVIAAGLAAADPENAATYLSNAATAQTELDGLMVEIDAILAPVRGNHYVVPHDGLQYFETAFDLPASGAVAFSDASTPGPARLQQVRDLVQNEGIVCVLTDPQVSPEWVELVREGTGANTAIADGLGMQIPNGPEHYSETLRALANNLATCLEP